MTERVLIIGSHGLGDCILSLQCASHIPHSNYSIYISARDEVFEPLNHCFKHRFELKQIHEDYGRDNNILKTPECIKELAQYYDVAYYIVPDLLFNSPHAFDYKKYKVHPQVIKQTRLLTSQATHEKIIYMGMATTTPGYFYEDTVKLAFRLAETFPDYTVYIPWFPQWAGQNTLLPDFPGGRPANLYLHSCPKFCDSLDWLKKSCYFIGTDNGPSHIAYHYGIPRLILDPQFNRLPWVARWKEDYGECIPITSPVSQVIELVKTNLEIPQTCLIPRMYVLTNSPCNWKNALYFKY